MPIDTSTEIVTRESEIVERKICEGEMVFRRETIRESLLRKDVRLTGARPVASSPDVSNRTWFLRLCLWFFFRMNLKCQIVSDFLAPPTTNRQQCGAWLLGPANQTKRMKQAITINILRIVRRSHAKSRLGARFVSELPGAADE